jgi:hypothetical protein
MLAAGVMPFEDADVDGIERLQGTRRPEQARYQHH